MFQPTNQVRQKHLGWNEHHQKALWNFLKETYNHWTQMFQQEIFGIQIEILEKSHAKKNFFFSYETQNQRAFRQSFEALMGNFHIGAISFHLKPSKNNLNTSRWQIITSKFQWKIFRVANT